MVVPHIRIFDKVSYEKKAFLNHHNQNTSSPVTGGEPDWNPRKWNTLEKIISHHNCYSYSTDTLSSHRNGKAQPGYFSGFDGVDEDKYHCANFLKRLKRDNPSFVLTTFGAKCPKGFHKAFIAIDPKDGDVDYHFYRQDSNGKWSHKPGKTEATDKDAVNKPIMNPLTADRKYSGYQYILPCFFFCVEKGLSRTSSQTLPSKLKNNKNNKNNKNTI